MIRGNHLQWLIDFINTGNALQIWTMQGGMATLKSYRDKTGKIDIPVKHIDLFNKSLYLSSILHNL